MAESLQRLYVEKESLRWHLKGFLDVRASFYWASFISYAKKRSAPGIITASLEAINIRWSSWIVNYQPNLPATLIDRA